MNVTVIKGDWARNPITVTIYLSEKEWKDLREALVVIHNHKSYFKRSLKVLELFAWQTLRDKLVKA